MYEPLVLPCLVSLVLAAHEEELPLWILQHRIRR
jgi:hypothetical protein